MKGSRFSEEQIIGIQREHETGAKTPDSFRSEVSIDGTADLIHCHGVPEIPFRSV